MTEFAASKITAQRKRDHLRINLEQNVQFPQITSGLEEYRFIHQAIPEINFDDIDTRLSLFNRKLQAPFLISSMTGGTPEALKINLILAKAAQDHGIAMGVGSQRAAIENPSLSKTFQIRSVAPDILLFANIGAVQLNYGYSLEHCMRAVDMINADALILHFNVLQEALQAKGDTQWGKLLNKIEKICQKLPVPLIAKEVGWGFSKKALQGLLNAGITTIDVSGSGGTSWSEVEYHRAQTQFQARLAHSFEDWGIPTARALVLARETNSKLTLFASGGIKNGIDVAKCIALGATLSGFAGMLLRAAAQSPETLDTEIKLLKEQLRITMLCTASATLNDLRNKKIERTK